MADVLGVDLHSDPLVTTAPLLESGVKNGEIVRQLEARQKWHERRLKGQVDEDEEPPPVPSDWVFYGPPLVAGVVVAVVLFIVVQGAADVLGHLFGFRPGLVGLWVG